MPIKSKMLLDLSYFCKGPQTTHHSKVWTKYEACLDYRSLIAVPLICALSLLRIILFTREEEKGLGLLLLLHRVGWLPIALIGRKWPTLCRFYLCYEMLASVLDSVLALKSATSQEACDYILLYVLLSSMLVYTAFQYKLWANIALVLVHGASVVLLCSFFDTGDYMPSLYQQVTTPLIQIVMAIVVHLLINRIGVWYVDTTVKMES